MLKVIEAFINTDIGIILLFLSIVFTMVSSMMLHGRIQQELISSNREPDWSDILIVCIPGVSLVVWLLIGIEAAYRAIKTMKPSTWPQQFFDYPPTDDSHA